VNERRERLRSKNKKKVKKSNQAAPASCMRMKQKRVASQKTSRSLFVHSVQEEEEERGRELRDRRNDKTKSFAHTDCSRNKRQKKYTGKA